MSDEELEQAAALSRQLVEKANWLIQQIHRDADVAAGFYGALAQRHYEDMATFATDDPDGFCAVVDAFRDMVEQIPRGEIR